MAETANRRLTSPSTMEMKAAIRETRVRLTTRLTRTADHVGVVFASPSSARAGARDVGVIGVAVNAIALAGRTRRTWNDAKRNGVLRRAAIGAAAVAIAAGVAAYRRRAKPLG